jgi:hypothetical protein
MSADPVDHETVRRQQPQFIGRLDRLQWPHPGVEVPIRQFGRQGVQATVPKRRFHAAAGLPG